MTDSKVFEEMVKFTKNATDAELKLFLYMLYIMRLGEESRKSLEKLCHDELWGRYDGDGMIKNES